MITLIKYNKYFIKKEGKKVIIDSHQHLILPTKLQFEKMEIARVDKAILFTTIPHPENAKNLSELKQEMKVLYKVLGGNITLEEKILSMKNNIKELLKVINQYPNKFLGFGPVPLNLDEESTYKWVKEYIVDTGLRGVGEFTPASREQMLQLEVIFKILQKFPGYPIWVHTFNPVTLEDIKILMDFCKNYPSVPVIFGHLGGYNWLEVLEFAKIAPNAYLDLSGIYSSMVAKIVINELPDKCFYSSDAPYGEPLLSRQIIEFVSSNKEISDKVLGKNISALLNIS